MKIKVQNTSPRYINVPGKSFAPGITVLDDVEDATLLGSKTWEAVLKASNISLSLVAEDKPKEAVKVDRKEPVEIVEKPDASAKTSVNIKKKKA